MSLAGLEWIDPLPVEVPAELEVLTGGSRLLCEALVRRGITTQPAAQAFLDPLQYYCPSPPGHLPDLEKAVERLQSALHNNERIGIWGDFDVDGQTATTLLVSALRQLGGEVIYYIPVRQRESHGVAPETFKSFLGRGVQLVVTCDTGVDAHPAVAYAAQQGVDFIITDHHTLPENLPPALAVVNPRRLEGGHPLSNLCGVGCAFKVVEALYTRLGRSAELEQFYDLVAIGSIADVAELRHDNRYLVRRGLQRLRSPSRLGIKVLLEFAEIDPSNLSEEHIAFAIAPRLNALGRLGDANPIVELLTTNDLELARQTVNRLEGLNHQRRLLCDQIVGAALAQIKNDPSLLNQSALVLDHPDWHPGVIGIVASRLADLYHRPVVLLTAPAGATARGSARSVEGVNITAAIAQNRDLLLSFGGHPMAAGLSLPSERIPEFRRGLARAVRDMTAGQPPTAPLRIDAELALDEISLETVDALERLAPFGPGNPPVLFVSRDLTLQSHAAIGKTGEHLQLLVEDANAATKKILWWQGAGSPLPEARFDLAYQVRANTFRGERQVQIEWVGFRELHPMPIELESEPQGIEFQDLRSVHDPLDAANRIPSAQCVVWKEGRSPQEVEGVDRDRLASAATLVIVNPPPSRAVLQAAMQTVQPQQVILFGFDPGSDQLSAFLEHLAGLLRYAINQHGGRVALSRLAAATAQRLETVQKGLEWLAASGHITWTKDDCGLLTLMISGKLDLQSRNRIEADLSALLKETAAFRQYYLRCNPSALLKITHPNQKM